MLQGYLLLIALSSQCIVCLVTRAQEGLLNAESTQRASLAANYTVVEFIYSFLSVEWFIFGINSPSRVQHHWTDNVFFSTENTRHGPVFTQEPSDSIFPLSTDDKQVFINCKAKGNPPPHYR